MADLVPDPARCVITPNCERGNHALEAHPCGGPFHIPGSPCAHCGQPTPTDGGPCPDCWTPATIADLKGLAADAGLDVHVTTNGAHRG